MNTNLQSQIPSPRALSGELWAAMAGAIGSALLLAKKLLGSRPAKPEPLSRAEFCAEMLAEQRPDPRGPPGVAGEAGRNHRELLAALERQAERINALECGLARVDERTRE